MKLEWDLVHGWAPPISTFNLNDGTCCELVSYKVSRTHAGQLEGTPRVYSVLRWIKQRNAERPTLLFPENLVPSTKDDPVQEWVLPPYQITIELESEALVKEDGCASWLRILYFTFDVSKFEVGKILDEVKDKIDWKKQAEDWSW